MYINYQVPVLDLEQMEGKTITVKKSYKRNTVKVNGKVMYKKTK